MSAIAAVQFDRYDEDMEIRSERVGDETTISALITTAFLTAEHSGGNEAEIVDGLRGSESLTVSLVALDGEDLVGHVAFSPVTIDGLDCGWYGLGPVAVRPDRQRHGVGASLIWEGLAMLRSQGARGCVVLGDPHFYGRFGFVADPAFVLQGVPPPYFQRLAFGEVGCGGLVAYQPAFGDT